MNFYHLDVLAYHVEVALQSITAPHKIYTYKTISEKGEIPRLELPWVIIREARQVGGRGIAKTFSYGQPYRDETRAAIWIASPIMWDQGGEQKGGFDAIHHPVVKILRELIRANLALDIPAELHGEYKTGTVGLLQDSVTGEDYSRLPDRQMERTVLYCTLYQYMPGGIN